MEEILAVNSTQNGKEGQKMESIKERVCQFFLHDQPQQTSLNCISTSNDDFQSQSAGGLSGRLSKEGRLVTQESIGGRTAEREQCRSNMWEYIIDKLEQKTIGKVETVFKQKHPRRYIQVKSQLINGGTQIMAICTDITRVKEIESQGRRMRSSFFSSVAHELRTPLNSVIPILKMVQDQMERAFDPQRVRRFIQIALNSSMHLENVIEDALDISRLENNKFQIFQELFTVRDLVKQVSDIMRFQVEQKGLTLIDTISDRVPNKIKSDQKRLKQVLFNLVGNAIKFTFKGSITIRLGYDEDMNQLQFSIKDTGVGIQPNDLNKLFKFFGTLAKTKDINRGGMGLGLTISKMIIQQLGGEINVRSIPDEGTEFSFWIPIDQIEYAAPNIEFQAVNRISQDQFAPSKREESSTSIQFLQGIKRRLSKFKRSVSMLNVNSQNDGTLSPVMTESDLYFVTEQESLVSAEEDLYDYDSSPTRSHLRRKLLDRKEQATGGKPTLSQMYLKLQAQSFYATQLGLIQKDEASQQPINFQHPCGELTVEDESSAEGLNSLQRLQQIEERKEGDYIDQNYFNSEHSRNARSRNVLRILCVDDSTYNLFVLTELLKSIDLDGCLEVESALNGIIALDMIKSNAHYDIILMDLHMPIKDGYQTAMEIRKIYGQLPQPNKTPKIFAISAITRSQFEQNIFSQYFNDFLEKPVNIEVVKGYVEIVKSDLQRQK
ncbi:hypothetical protein FGO68_gene14129 [Halteria grandinella]|uniref:Histidine kinase n=1 Tax=Halteria grandinella TaxID=5974 RepID=A0A8J8T7Y1_HALGN|nr:hypothetical protein FGO68_gene14129 [Halteria grandinella]